MLRGRRLPLPQSPLSRWRTTAPAHGLRRMPATASFLSTTAVRRNDDANDGPPKAESKRENGKAARGAKSRLRIHKIGVYGDDWSFYQAVRSAQPTTRHVQSSLRGENPFSDRKEYEQHVAMMNARRIRKEYEKHVAAMKARRQSRMSQTRHAPPHKAKEAPRSTEAKADVLADGLQGTMARGSQRPAPDGQRLGADQPQGPVNRRAELDSPTDMPPKVKEAITRQYKLVASEIKPLFSSRQYNALDALSQQEPHQARPIDAAQYSGELPVAVADIGPAETLQRSFIEDPVLMKAKTLVGPPPISIRSSSRLEFSSEPRFRLVPSWGPTVGKAPRSGQPSKEQAKSLESHISELQIENETKGRPEPPLRPGQISDSRPSISETTSSEWSETANDAELKASEDRAQLDTQDTQILQDEGSGAGDEGDRVVEPVQAPAPDNRTIFEKLFTEQERLKESDQAQLSSKLRATLAARREKPIGVDRQNMLETAQQNDLNARHGLSIFRQLFPEQAESETAQSETETSHATHEILQPPDDSVFVSLRNEVRNWVSEEGQAQKSWPRAGDYGSHSTVVVISGTSPSLMDTDFYRIAPEGKHVEGWAGGLVKVIQAHDSISYEPLGQYYLMFHSRPSALAYVDEVWRLHELSRRQLHAPGDSGRETAKGSLDQAPASPQAFLTDEERAAVRSFTLFSPYITPHVSVRMWNTELVKELAAKSNIADVLPTLRPEGSTPARVLLKLTSPDGQHGEGRGGLTADELWLTLRDDGRERSAPWVLANLTEGIMPVKPRFISEHYKITIKAELVPMPLELRGDDDDGGDGLHAEDGSGVGPVADRPPPEGANGDARVDRNERFRRFVLTFTQPATARRFVRCWHKRVVYDALLDRSVVIDAVAIM